MKYFLAFVISLLSITGFAQTPPTGSAAVAHSGTAAVPPVTGTHVLHGKVTDMVTSRGIPFAKVIVTDGSNNTHATLSDGDGSYRIERLPGGKLTVSCSDIGFSPNPSIDTVELNNDVAEWNPQLVDQGADAAYASNAAHTLATLPDATRIAEARYLAVNLPPSGRSAVATQLLNLNAAHPSPKLSYTAALFTTGQTSDKEIQTAMTALLVKDHAVPSSDINVEVSDGHARLTGTVATEIDKDRAYMTVTKIPSASDVANDLTVTQANINGHTF
jgi:hypothetical protein